MGGGVGAPERRAVTFARLNVALGVVLIALVTGPAVARWYAARRASPPSSPWAVPSAPAASRPAASSTPSGVEPSAPAAPPGPEAAGSREALSLHSPGPVAGTCEGDREAATDEARRNLGACLARLGREAYEANQLELAVQRYQRAVDVDPGAHDLWTSLATAHAKAGDLERARAVLLTALGRFDDDAEALYLLADIQERQGRTREAIATLGRLLAAHPSHARGQRLLASLDREQKVEGSYWTQESAHFLVRYEGAQGIDLGRSVIDTLENAYESIGRDLATYPKTKVQVGIYASPVFGEVLGVPPHLLAGAYDGRKIRLNLSAATAYSHTLSRMVRHEYTHLLIHQATNGHAPIWLHEGLAQAEEPRSAPRLLPVGSIPRGLLSLGGIERLSRTGDGEALMAGYSLTHVAVQYLLDRGGFSSMRDLLARLGRGEPLPAAMRAAFGVGPDEVEARLLAAAGKS